MASLIKKIKKGKPYYYIVECQRIDGKPKIVHQTYLGTPEKILKNQQNATAPTAQEVELSRVGPMALWDVAESLGLPAMIDAAFTKRKQGPSISQFIILAALGRAFAPCSKAQIGDWYETTALRQAWGHSAASFTSQRFWDAMERIELEPLRKLETAISLHIAQCEQLSPKALLYDCTNYFTYIDTLNQRNSEAQRGHNKQGRNNLRQLGLAVAVTPDFHIPLFHHLYAGNRNDITELHVVYDELVARFQALASGNEELTLVADKGNMSEEMLFMLQKGNIHLIASAATSNHADLQNDLSQFQEADPLRLAGVTAWRGTKNVMGYDWTVVVEHSTNLAAQQYQAIATEQAKSVIKLEDIAKQLQRHQLPKATESSVKAKVLEILKAQHMRKLIDFKITARDNYPVLTYALNHEELQNLMNYQLGRVVLFTNQHAWSNADVILAYRGQFEVENFFRDSKNPDYLSFQPPYHWTDQKLHVHAFYCVLALALTAILRRRLSQQGISLSTERLLEELHTLQEATLFYPASKRDAARISYCLVRPNATQKDLLRLLDLQKHTHLPVTDGGKTGIEG